jgi:hypothetical protein
MPNSPIKFYTLIAKPRKKKHKKVKNININPSNRIVVLTQEQTAWNNRIAHIQTCEKIPFGLVNLK